jgi:hypothetical protein
MRSYYAHLETAMNVKTSIPGKPVFRSSAIFPVIHNELISSRILFMGYWILKRHIHEIGAVISLRNEIGDLLLRKNFSIEKAKTYRVEVNELLKELEYKGHFQGSLEIEFFSSVNLVFPYPAVVINYYGPEFSSVVHTAQRVYNDFEDLKKNSETNVPESGFNIYVNDLQEPFISFINGPQQVEDEKVSLEFYNCQNEKLKVDLNLGPLQAYQTYFLYPAQHCNLKDFLKGKVGAAKVFFKVNWIFPRLVVGNMLKSTSALSITHTYYDCTKAISKSDYWLEPVDNWHQAALQIPICAKDGLFTNIYFYPIYSPSNFSIDVEFYDSEGRLLGKKEQALHIDKKEDTIRFILLKELCHELKIDTNRYLGARLIAKVDQDERLPARIKLGLDIGYQKNPTLPCNICTNLQPFNPALEGKLSSFKWLPLLSLAYIMNGSPEKNYQKSAQCKLTFFREQDDSAIVREVTLPPFGFLTINLDVDLELKNFFNGKIGWCTVQSTNPYTTTYYFSLNPSGMVGGDHGF